MDNKQQYALITGATEGIGKELAKQFADNGFNLVLVARSKDELAATASELQQQSGAEVITVQKDLMKRESPFEVFEEVKAKGIQVDVLVNNAAQGKFGEFVKTDIQEELDMVQLNIGAYITFTKLYLKEMVARNSGKILIVSSVAGEIPGPLQAVYHGTKAFLNSFTVALREEIRDMDIKITTLMPGPTDTGFFEKADMEDSKMVQEGKLADPAKVAEDGFEALMAGEREVISGFKNKAMVAGTKLMPDRMAAKGIRKQSEPEDKSKKEE